VALRTADHQAEGLRSVERSDGGRSEEKLGGEDAVDHHLLPRFFWRNSVQPLSKKIQLGVIILALQLLGELNFPLLRVISKVAKKLGLSRKTGYQSAKRIEGLLRNPPGGSGDAVLRRELLQLRIRNQVLTYERDHPDVRFSDRHRHLPDEAKLFCVRVLRDFRSELSESEIAVVIGVPLSSLERWDSEANSDCQFPSKPDGRGLHRRASPEDIERVLNEYKKLKEPLTLEEFTERFNALYPEAKLDRRTITRILQGNGLRKIETRNNPEPYHEPFKVYFPGAQVAIDGKECGVVFRSEPGKAFTFNKELAIDIASGAILGKVQGKTETADGVEQVLVQVQEEYKSVLALLCDNRSSNQAADVKGIFQWESEEARIFSFPYHPQTNGHMEGVFSQFVRIAGKIEIDDTTKETLAFSIVEVVWRIFIYFYNYSPRKRLGGLGPLEYFRRYLPLPEEVEAAKKKLREQAERSRALRKSHPRLSDPAFRSTVQRLLERHRLKVDLQKALRALIPYDLKVIESSSNAFYAQSQRDGFDEGKRTFAYFMGIVSNKQKELDRDRLRSQLEAQKARKIIDERQAMERKRQEEKAQEEKALRSHPEEVILKYAERFLILRMQYMKRTLTELLQRGLQALHDLGRANKVTLEKIAMEIRSWGKYSEELKEKMIKLLFEECGKVAKPP
jgi:transposase InsO family protein